MTDQTAIPQVDQLEIEQAPVIMPSQDQQIRDWIVTHKLEACRVCGAFRLNELGLTELMPAIGSRRPPLGPSRS